MAGDERHRGGACSTVIEKSLFTVHGHNTTVVEYQVHTEGTRTVELELRPLIAFRDYHALMHENPALGRRVQVHHDKLVSVRPYSGHSLRHQDG
jgi:Glycogen debranching enzyme N terminal